MWRSQGSPARARLGLISIRNGPGAACPHLWECLGACWRVNRVTLLNFVMRKPSLNPGLWNSEPSTPGRLVTCCARFGQGGNAVFDREERSGLDRGNSASGRSGH